MFLSESHLMLVNDRLDERTNEEYLNISMQNKNSNMIEDESLLFNTKGLSKSENDIPVKTGAWGKKINRKKRSNSLSYDADTDTDPEEISRPPVPLQNILQCEICHLEYTSCHEDKFNMFGEDEVEGSPSPSSKRKTKQGRRKSRNSERRETTKKMINFEDYKDWSHRMEEFSADAERVWTLQYSFDKYQPKLSKIIIGRGHRNEYPELNNIHLFDEVNGFASAVWRNVFLEDVKARNDAVKSNFGLYPTNSTCLFCFEERSTEVIYAMNCGLPLKPKTPVRPTGMELVRSRNLSKTHRTTEVDSDRKKTLKITNFFKKLELGKKNGTKIVEPEDTEDDEEFTVI